jgi:hypothetical protein
MPATDAFPSSGTLFRRELAFTLKAGPILDDIDFAL